MSMGTTAELEERASEGFEKYRRVTARTFLIAGFSLAVIPVFSSLGQYTDGEFGLAPLILALAGLAVFLWGYHRLVRDGLNGRASVRDIVLTGAVAAALNLMVFSHPTWMIMPVFWAATVALSIRSMPRLIALTLGTAAWMTAATVLTDDVPGDRNPWLGIPAIYAVFSFTCAFAVFVNRYQMRMWDLHQEAHAARQAQARLAVTEERLRFSRDLHDLLGHSLSLIAVKSELAMRMTENDPAAARAEMTDVRNAARGALREVRAAVRGYRAVELDAELAGVRSVLESAGVRCETGGPPPDLPPEVRSVLAWVIREGATNVIKHSEARNCRISITRYGASVVLEMVNDGAKGADGGSGSGLTGLAERVRVVGGDLTAERDGRDGFLLRVVVPVTDEPDAPEAGEAGAAVGSRA
ncbi:histidine kinase [Spirillospora sp. NPDC047279]|uniref:sensor histidine kinase n=1 Tax=Spirillospora sp. NPDC047279 TaxID=3155478 RepID=UPI0033F49DA4